MRRDTSRTEPTPSVDASAAHEPVGCAAGTSFERLFLGQPHVVLAVSGGSDSMALMHLAVAWRAGRSAGLPAFSVVTVDHGLREGSAAEALQVGVRAAELGLAHTILRWQGPKPTSGIQAAARIQRYDLIGKHLEAAGLGAVATAHTNDDQSETLLMRLARGSGIDGLAAMRPRSKLAGGQWLLRPLLDVRKSDLAAYLEARRLSWIEDPSNSRSDFERVRVRDAIAAAAAAGFPLDAQALGRTANRSRRAADALAWLTARCWSTAGEHGTFHPLGFATLDWGWLIAQPEEIRLRLLAALTDRIGGQSDRVSLGQLEAVTAGRDWRRPSGSTLHGTEWTPAGERRLHIWREAGRIERCDPGMALAGGSVTWDRRFTISREHAASPAFAGPLLADGLAEIEARGFERPPVPARALWGLPAVRVGGAIVSVPGAGFAAPGSEGLYRSDALLPHFGADDVPS